MRRHENEGPSATEGPDCLDEFLAQPADVGTTQDDIDDAGERDAEQARSAAIAKSEGAVDLYAPRPPVMDIDF
jgi:hypothetical protein